MLQNYNNHQRGGSGGSQLDWWQRHTHRPSGGHFITDSVGAVVLGTHIQQLQD